MVFTLTTWAQQWINLGGSTPNGPKVSLISSNEKQVVVNFTLSGFNMTKVITQHGVQQIISVPKMAAMLEAGAPDLPQFPIPVIIGDLSEMSVKITSNEYTDYEGIEVAPSKGNFSRQIDPESVPYTYGEMYSQNAFYPAQQAYLEAPYILRDFRGQNIMVRPFTYNPVTKTLRIYHNITIEMYKVSDNGVNPKTTRKSGAIKIDPQFKADYNRRFINYGQSAAKYTFVEDQGEMIVICPEQYMEAMQPLVDWKNQSGRPTTLVSLTEAGGNSDTQIKNYIQSIYNDHHRNLAFVLLVGDYADLTPHSMSGGRSDNWFVMLDGSDYYTEAFIGRFSVNNVNDVTHQVNKVLYYERDMTSNVTYVDKGLGIGCIGAGSGHFGEDDYQHIDYIRDSLLHYTYSTVTELHGGGGGASTSSISAAINSGVSIINYCNHGSETSWGVANYSTSNVNALTNDNKWPYIISVACLNGQFNYSSGDCFAEAWMKATNNSTGVPTGAIGGMFSWISQPWIPPMYGQDEMIDILCEWRSTDLYNHTMGGTSLNGSMYILDAVPSDNGETHNTWLLFGDPSLLLRTDNPTDINLTCNPSQLLVGMTTLTVNAMDVDYGIATLSMNGEVLASAQIANGSATLNFDAVSTVGDATLTVIAFNKVTEIQTIEVIPAEGAFLTVSGCTPNSSVVGTPTQMSMNIQNLGEDPTLASGTATISCQDENLYIITGSTNFDIVPGGETIELEDAFTFAIAEDVANGTHFQIDITMTSGEETWTGKTFVTAAAPDCTISSITNTDLDPGMEDGVVTFVITNEGDADAYDALLQLTSSSTDLVLNTSVFSFDTIAAGETIAVEFQIAVDSTVEIGSTYELDYVFVTGQNTINGAHFVTVGKIIEDFETGDFSSFEWEFANNANWTIVDNGANNGTYCAKSGTISDRQSTSLVLTIEVLAAGDLSFYKKVSSENNYDFLRFYIDNVEKGSWSGNVNWSQESYPVTAGTHTFKWTYEKDAYVSNGSDCAWIDDIQFPPTHVVTALDAVENLQALVDMNVVTLTWNSVNDATSYVILRNGEEIAIVLENSFTESVDDGEYTYTVIAADEEGHFSAPAFVNVMISTDAVSENESVFTLYPNPARSILYINGGQSEFDYAIYNGIGQQVANGKGNGNCSINISNLTKGVYFIRITNGMQSNMQKVVVE